MSVERIDDALLVDVARSVVREIAPQELPLYRANSEMYLKDPDKALRGKRSGDRMLGFGTGVEVALITPIALAVVSEVLKFLAAEVGKTAKREGAALVEAQVKRLFGKFRTEEHKATDPPPLTGEQLARVRAIAYET